MNLWMWIVFLLKLIIWGEFILTIGFVVSWILH